MSGIVTIPYAQFTFSRAHGNTLVSEASDLVGRRYFPKGAWPANFRVRGQRDTVLYQRAPKLDVYAGAGSDRELAVAVYAPAPPYSGRAGVPLVHVLND